MLLFVFLLKRSFACLLSAQRLEWLIGSEDWGSAAPGCGDCEWGSGEVGELPWQLGPPAEPWGRRGLTCGVEKSHPFFLPLVSKARHWGEKRLYGRQGSLQPQPEVVGEALGVSTQRPWARGRSESMAL